MTSNWMWNPSRSSLGVQLDHLLLACLPAHWATRIWLPSELPVQLERCVLALPPRVEWRAYSDDFQTWCAVGCRAAGITFQSPAITLEVYFLDGDASVCAAGVWEYDGERRWQLSNVLDVVSETCRPSVLPFLQHPFPLPKQCP